MKKRTSIHRLVRRAGIPRLLPLREVAERSEDGEGESFRNGRKTLSVTCGDSSPKGKGFAAFALQALINVATSF